MTELEELEFRIRTKEKQAQMYLDRCSLKQQLLTSPESLANHTFRSVDAGWEPCIQTDAGLEPCIQTDAGWEPYIQIDAEKHLFYEECYYAETHNLFESTIPEVLLAEYHLNRNFVLRGSALLNEFYEFLGLPKTNYGNAVGWDDYIGDIRYGYNWIDFMHSRMIMEDGLEVISIEMPFAPTDDCVTE